MKRPRKRRPLNTSLQIRLASIAILGLLTALCAMAYYSGRKVERDSGLIAQDAVPGTIHAHYMRMAISRSFRAVLVAASALKAESRDENLKTAHEADAAFEEEFTKYQATIKVNPEEDRALLALVRAKYAAFIGKRLAYEDLILKGDREGCATFLEHELLPLFLPAIKAAEDLIKYNHVNSLGFSSSIRRSISNLYWVVEIVMVLALACTVVLLFNLTIRRRELEELKESEGKFSKAFKSNPSGIAITELGTGRYIDVNDSYCRIMGFSRGEMIGNTSLELGIWESPGERSQRFGPLYAGGSLHGMEMNAIMRDGSRKAINVNAEPIEMGGRKCVISSVVDITERRELQRKQAQLAAIVECSEDAIIGKSLDGIVTSWNRGAEKIFGYTVEEAIGQELLILFPPERKAEETEILARIARGETVQHFESVRVRKDGRKIFISATISPLRDGDGKVIGASKIARDITEQRLAEVRIRQLNRIYAVLSAINQTIVHEKDPQAMLTKACETAVEKGGFRMAWVGLHDSAAKIVKPVASAGVVDGYLDLVNIDLSDQERSSGPTGRCFQSGEHSICNDIEHDSRMAPWRQQMVSRGYRSSASFPLKVEGRITGVFTLYSDEAAFFCEEELKLLDELAMDISFALEVGERESRRRQVEQELRWRTAFFEAQVYSAIDGILVLDSNSKKLLQNRRMNELWKIPPHIADDPDDAPQFQYVLGRVKDPEYFVQKTAHLNAHPDESSSDVIELVDGTILERYSAPVRGSDGTYYGRVWTFHDITERKKLEQQFLRAQRMESIGTLASGVAHDLNNILTPIMMSVAVLRMGLPKEKSDSLCDTIEMSAQRGAQIVKQVLAFGRGYEGEKQPLMMRMLIQEIEQMIRSTFPKNIRIETQVEPTLRMVLGDATQLHQVLLNLCVNARDAMPDGGRLLVSAANLDIDLSYASMLPELAPGAYVLLKVSDTGSGIPPEILERIFDPFFTTKGVGKGTGLGLSTVHGIIKSHGGILKVESLPGEGTSFQVYLPAALELEEATDVGGTSAPPVGNGELVLVVDDESAITSAARSVLEANGYRVLLACDGVEAIDTFSKHMNEIAVVLTDVMMPVIDGLLFIRTLRKLSPGMLVIGSTAEAEKGHLDQLNALRVEHVLRKPYNAATLLRAIHGVLHPGQ